MFSKGCLQSVQQKETLRGKTILKIFGSQSVTLKEGRVGRSPLMGGMLNRAGTPHDPCGGDYLTREKHREKLLETVGGTSGGNYA